jgi:Fe-S cluster biogenesis protein NfuA
VSHLCTSRTEAAGSPLLEALFAIEGISQVWLAGAQVTLRKTTTESWTSVGPRVGAALRAFAAIGQAFTPPIRTSDVTTVRARIERILEEQVNPGVASHGGKIELEDFRDGQAYLRMSGGCQGCSSAKATLGQGVEKVLRAHIPELRGIVDVTDHARGERPFQ